MHFVFRTSTEKREEKVNDTYEEIEKGLKLIGATAIEDKLQDGVPQCIEHLARAGIKIWVLTGDKVGKLNRFHILFVTNFSFDFREETAYNIGLSCRLLTNDMEISIIEEETERDVEKKLQEIRNHMISKIEELFDVHIDDRERRLNWKDWGIDVMKFDQHRKATGPSLNGAAKKSTTTYEMNSPEREQFEGFGLLITGQALAFALKDNLKMKFLELGTMCKAVVCCRVTPLQKAQVVELVMQNEKKITLAIGDGANDVSMIQSKTIFSSQKKNEQIRCRGAHRRWNQWSRRSTSGFSQ